MSNTNSLAFPQMFNVSQNNVAVVEDSQSVANRSRLLLLTEPTELFNNPSFGGGLKRHLWKYNTQNETAIIKDRIIEQLRLHEPCVDSEQTRVIEGLQYSGGDAAKVAQEYNKLNLTVVLITKYGDEVEVEV